MGTRGIYGFYKNKVDKLAYNHWDSYPDILGKNIVDFIKETNIEEMNNIFDKIILVDQNSEPTLEQIRECKKWADLSVSSRQLNEWYVLLRKTQGNLNAFKTDLKYMIDGKDFIKESLSCEWGYIINLDTNKFEVYRGFQTENQDNRYKLTQNEVDRLKKEYEYYNCKLIKEFDLKNVPEDWVKIIEKLTEGDEED